MQTDRHEQTLLKTISPLHSTAGTHVINTQSSEAVDTHSVSRSITLGKLSRMLRQHNNTPEL